MIVLEIVFWAAAGLLVYSQVGYPLLLAVAAVVKRKPAFGRRPPAGTAKHAARETTSSSADLPFVSLIIAAYAEQDVIGDKVANARSLDYPSDRFEVIVGCDGSPDQTAANARAAGADKVLELPRAGKIRTQDEAVETARGELLVFSDANSFWHPDALRNLISAFDDPAVGYACGQVTFINAAGTNQEGVYWRYEMWLRGRESQLASVTGGNGAIYATRRESYINVDPIMGHDLSLPFNMVKRGWRAHYVAAARAEEKMVPTVEGEFRRKRRMMSHAWPIVVRGGMLSPRHYGPTYAWMIFSHRLLRYAAPFLHLVALVASAVLAFESTLYLALLGAQAVLLAAAVAGARIKLRPLLIARYYVLTTASLALGLWDWLRHGTPAGWSPPEGTR